MQAVSQSSVLKKLYEHFVGFGAIWLYTKNHPLEKLSVEQLLAFSYRAGSMNDD